MKKKIIIAGGSGFIGQELANYFKDKFLVIVLTRGNSKTANGITFVNWMLRV
jgi:nucleoside-diphosphate-sugar epimerase